MPRWRRPARGSMPTWSSWPGTCFRWTGRTWIRGWRRCDSAASPTPVPPLRSEVVADQRRGLRIVVDAVHTETEQLEEVAVVAFEVGQLEQVFFRHLRPDRLYLCLGLGPQLLIVHAEASCFIQPYFFAVETLGEQALQLLDAAFVGALLLHHLDENGQVQRHHRNRRTGLG